jgi:hypothetical protein
MGAAHWGYNFQFGAALIGVEADYGWFRVNGDGTCSARRRNKRGIEPLMCAVARGGATVQTRRLRSGELAADRRNALRLLRPTGWRPIFNRRSPIVDEAHRASGIDHRSTQMRRHRFGRKRTLPVTVAIKHEIRTRTAPGIQLAAILAICETPQQN